MDNGITLKSHAVILAAGGRPNKLNIPGETEYYGKGVSYCAVCDGFFFRNKTALQLSVEATVPVRNPCIWPNWPKKSISFIAGMYCGPSGFFISGFKVNAISSWFGIQYPLRFLPIIRVCPPFGFRMSRHTKNRNLRWMACLFSLDSIPTEPWCRQAFKWITMDML